MAFLHRISLTQFRNYQQQDYTFSSHVTAISGLNGCGKTNLLDAIYYLCFTKSAFSRADAQNVKEGCAGFRIEGVLENKEGQNTISAILRETGKKEFAADGNNYKKMSEHIGLFPCVFIAPDDVSIITGNSEERRKLVDMILSQIVPAYLQHLIHYNKVLAQRNSLLRAARETGNLDSALLDIYDQQIMASGQTIFETRNTFLSKFIPTIIDKYGEIAGKNDHLHIQYKCQLSDQTFAQLLLDGRQKDILTGRSNYGIHKDDLEIYMGDILFKNMASQGQRKSLLFAIKLSEFQILTTEKGETPILLLDDIFEKLDAHRMHNLLHEVCITNQGQVFITDTHADRIKETFEKINVSYQALQL